MTHLFIQGMAGGWCFGFRPTLDQRFIYPEEPVFVRFHSIIQQTEERTPMEVARLDEGRSAFNELKRWLDHADARMGYDAQGQPAWRAADKAKMAMEDVLRQTGRWSDDLLETGVELT